jgi:U3 small nucleolar RNA-associated protein 5
MSSSSNSLITSEFSDDLLSGIAFTSISLDTPILKYQPLKSSTNSSVSPVSLEISSKPTNILWLDDSHFIILYSNKPYFELFETSNISSFNQHIDLTLSSNPASCSSATFNKILNTLYVIDTSNRLHIYIFDKFAYSNDKKLENISNYVITELTETISKITSYSNNKLLLMSNALYEFNLETKKIEKSLNLFVEQTNCFQLIDNYLLISSNNDRFINLIDLNKFKVSTIFVMNSPIIKFKILKYKKKSILAAIDQDGFVELFKDPLNYIQQNELNNNLTPNSKRRRRNGINLVKSIQYDSILKLFNDETYKTISKIDNIIFQNDQLIISYLQNENYFIIDKFNWFKNINEKLQSEIKIIRKKSSIDHLKLISQDKASLNNYGEDPSTVTIRTGDNFIDLDPIFKENENENEEEDDEDDDGDDFSTLVSRLDKTTNASSSSFIGKKQSNKFKFQVGTLTTNLSQSLRNNDNSMFDTIINTTTDEKIVKTTISQLEQHSILKMLDKLAELVFKNKFKNTNESASLGLGNSSIGLTTWIRYVLVYHGTYLINAAGGNAELRRRLGLLALSMNKRASNINRLLELKGNLAMVSLKASVTRELENLGGHGEDHDEEDVEYIEEEEELDEEEEEEEEE